jgi:hypothetical protein
MKPTAARWRAGFTLIQVIGLLPIILAITIAAYALADRVEGMQAREAARRVDDLRVRDVVRRIQEDAAEAERAVTVFSEGVAEKWYARPGEPTTQPAEGEAQLAVGLMLTSPRRTVAYRSTPGKITRLEQIDDGPTVEYAWALGSTEIVFKQEDVGGQPRLVWILCKTLLSFDSGPDLERRLTAVATIDRGGAR